MAESIFGVSSVIFKTRAAFLLPASAMVRSLMLLTVVSAVSADEKKEDRYNKIIKTIA
jgi:hypothetical protein